jgi:hypothetical protein
MVGPIAVRSPVGSAVVVDGRPSRTRERVPIWSVRQTVASTLARRSNSSAAGWPYSLSAPTLMAATRGRITSRRARLVAPALP